MHWGAGMYYPHELGQAVFPQGLLLEVARRLGRLLAAVHKDEHLVLSSTVQRLHITGTCLQLCFSPLVNARHQDIVLCSSGHLGLG